MKITGKMWFAVAEAIGVDPDFLDAKWLQDILYEYRHVKTKQAQKHLKEIPKEWEAVGTQAEKDEIAETSTELVALIAARKAAKRK